MHTDEQLGAITLLADPELEVIGRFGLRHHRTLRFSSPVLRLFGLPLGLPVGFEAMAIPTTLLVDEHGIVRWIDQADDYRIRSDAERVTSAIAEVFGDAPAGRAPSQATLTSSPSPRSSSSSSSAS